MKKNIITVVALVALVALGSLAFAAPRGGRGAGQGQGPLTVEQRTAVQQVYEAHQDKMYELREKIWAKHAELQALSNSGKAEKNDIQNLVGEISKLRDALHKERMAIDADIEKKTGLKGFGYGGYHRGGMGGGMGAGMGGACGNDCGPGAAGKGFGRGMNSCVGGACN